MAFGNLPCSKYVFPIFSLTVPLWENCLFFAREVYTLRASLYSLLLWYSWPRLRHTEKVRSRLIWSPLECSSLFFERARSSFAASLALSSAMELSPLALRDALSSRALWTSRSSVLHCCSKVCSGFFSTEVKATCPVTAWSGLSFPRTCEEYPAARTEVSGRGPSSPPLAAVAGFMPVPSLAVEGGAGLEKDPILCVCSSSSMLGAKSFSWLSYPV
mmetsp:Transcript_456/g.1740  ORF Transcript_456/g.1740 Transcript_456/m.1740 type:complete len:216 (-) Transcript_456:160-807(-)